MDISKLKVLIWDLGLQSELAKTIAEKVAEVKYYVPANLELYPTPLKSFIGRGLEGVERVNKFFPYVDKADAIIVPESQLGEVVSFLQRHKYPVAGPGDEHTWMETERWRARKAQADMGLPTQESESLQGVEDLAKFFETHSDWMVKGNGYRGLFDSFKVRNKRDLEPVLNYLRFKLGPFCEDLPFMVEECLEGLETGYDTISWSGEQLWPGLLSLAAKDEGYLCKVCGKDEMPPGYRLMHKLLMKELGSYRFFYSVETITGKDQVPYLIDLTLRIGSPSPLSIYLDLYENFAEIICGMAVGEKIAPKVKEGAKYAASANHTLDECENFTNIEIPKEVRPWAKLVRGCKKSGDFYSVPDWKVGVTVLGFGKTPKEAIEEAKNRSKEIKGKSLVDSSRFLDDYFDDIEKAKTIGIDF